MTTAERLAGFAADAGRGLLTEAARSAAKLVVLDTLTCVIAGTAVQPRAGMLHRAAMRTAGPGRSTLLGTGEDADPATAAGVNAESGGALSAQESFYFSHSANLHLAVALALCQDGDRSGADLLASFVTGFEVSAALHVARPAAPPPETPLDAYQPSRNEYMVVGAAAAAAVARGLSQPATAHALAIAAATAPGDAGNVAPLQDINYCDYTSKGRAAVVAALLAGEGLRGRLESIDERILGGAAPVPGALERLGRQWAVEETSIKFSPGCRFISGPIDSFAALVRDHALAPDDIAEVEVRVSALALSNPKIRRRTAPDPADSADPLNLVFNAPYHAALVAHGVAPSAEWYWPAQRGRPEVADFMARVRVVEDAAMTAQLRRDAATHPLGRVARSGGAGVRVRLRTGEELHAKCGFVRGDAVDDTLRATFDDVVAKAHGFLDAQVGADAVDRMADAVRRLDELGHVGELVEACRGTR